MDAKHWDQALAFTPGILFWRARLKGDITVGMVSYTTDSLFLYFLTTGIGAVTVCPKDGGMTVLSVAT
jgi:hypothetical protein